MKRSTRFVADLLLVASIALLLLSARTAAAQPSSFPGLTGPAGGRSEVEASPETGPAPKESVRGVKLFDQRSSRAFYELDFGPIWLRKVTEREPGEERKNAERGTGEISFGTAYVNETSKRVFLTGVQRTLLRIGDSKVFSWSVFVQDLGGGIRLGPLEPEARISLSVLTVDVFRGEWSAQLLSPRVMAGLGLALGKFRLDIKAHSEYLWRWFGPDYLAHGVTLGLRLEIPKPKSPFVDSR
jgi:hypothetical protein